jgi:benzoyl-CoA reductase/2-hydroxyglutaryl-CoA dehydratase subunit BcrC/BadD/HgdB
MADLIHDINLQVDGVLAHAAKKYPERMWMFDIQKSYWDQVDVANDTGKPLVLVGACAPVELVYAFGATPFLFDMIPTRLASQVDQASKYIDLAEKHVGATMCGIDKIDLGAVLSGDFCKKFDAFLYSTVPCDNSRAVYPWIADYLGMPSYCIDIPFRKDETGYRYMAKQYDEAVTFLEETLHKKLDWDYFVELMEISNKINEYMIKLAELRKNIPCPLPGRSTVMNMMIPKMVGHMDMLKFCEIQYEIGLKNLQNGVGAIPEEKYRLCFLQNMPWANVSLLDWLEREHKTIMVMDAFGYQRAVMFENPKDRDQVMYDFARKALLNPMIHGASGPVEDYIWLVENLFEDYKVNLSIFAGHVGCKHTWATSKIISDLIQTKFGLPTLYIDMDSTDLRYKSNDEVRATITEYIETIDAGRKH